MCENEKSKHIIRKSQYDQEIKLKYLHVSDGKAAVALPLYQNMLALVVKVKLNFCNAHFIN